LGLGQSVENVQDGEPVLSQTSEGGDLSGDHTILELNKLLSLCETQFLRARNQNFLAEKLAESTHRRTLECLLETMEFTQSPFLQNAASSQYQEAMHSALMKAMEERDEAHARMVAANVLHVHETEQQKKKVALLAAQLEAAQSSSSNTAVKNGVNNQGNELSKLSRMENEMQQNSEAELVALCQQLAREISNRTEAALEVARLKASRQIERKYEQAEKDQLQDEISQLKEQLIRERKKSEAAQQETENWKEYVQGLLQAREGNVHTNQ